MRAGIGGRRRGFGAILLVSVLFGVIGWLLYPKEQDLPTDFGGIGVFGVVILFDRPGVHARLYENIDFKGPDKGMALQLVFESDAAPPDGTRFALVASGVEFASGEDLKTAGRGTRLLSHPRGKPLGDFDGYSDVSPQVIVGRFDSKGPQALRIPNYSFPKDVELHGQIRALSLDSHHALVALKPGPGFDGRPFIRASGTATAGSLPYVGSPRPYGEPTQFYLEGQDPTPWYVADTLPVSIAAGALDFFDTVQSVNPPLTDPNKLEWATSNGSAVSFRVERGQALNAQRQDDTTSAFFAGVAVAVGVNLLIFAVQLAYSRSRAEHE
jgi:hypothetical protein